MKSSKAIYYVYSVLFSRARSKIKTSCPIDKWIVLQRVHYQIYFQKAQVVLVLECRVGALQEPFDVLPVECNVERLTYSIIRCILLHFHF